MHKKIVLIDICGTLYDSNTTIDFLDFCFHRSRKYNFFRTISRILFVRLLNRIILILFRFDLIRFLGISFLKGWSKKDIKNATNSFYDNFLRFRIRDISMSILKKCRENNSLVIISGTLDCVAEKVAKELNISTFFSSKLQYDSDICKGKLSIDILYKKKDVLDSYGYASPFEITISDNLSDINLMKLSKMNYIVCQNKKLKKWKDLIQKERLTSYKFVLVK